MAQREFEALLKFANERENIRIKKERGDPYPWTKDVILRDNRFTNVHRYNDTVTRWIKTHVIDKNKKYEHLWFLCLVCRVFNRVETLKALLDAGLLSKADWDPGLAYKALSKIRDRGPVFGAAYIVASPVPDKLRYFTHRVIKDAWKDRERISLALSAKGLTMQSATDTIRTLHGFGAFLAYEIVLDLKLSPLLKNASDLDTWTSFGPGSMRGLKAIYGQPVLRSEAVSHTVPILEYFQSRWKHAPLNLDDVENLLCEYSKYSRKQTGGRMKRKYSPELQGKLL